MKRTLVGSLAAAAALVLPHASAAAVPEVYGSFSAGYLVPLDNDAEVSGVDGTVKYDDGFALNAAIGYAFESGFRTEIEVGYGQTAGDEVEALGASAELDGADVDILTATANAFFDIKTGTNVRPYIGGGVGVAHTEVDDFSALGIDFEGGDETDLMALGEIGLGIGVGENVVIAPAYRFLWIDNGRNGFEDDKAHLFKVGVRVRF